MAASNQGLALAEGEYIVFLDNDTIVTKNWLQIFINLSKSLDPRVGVFGPMSDYVSGPQEVKGLNYSNYDELQRFACRWGRAQANNFQYAGSHID